MHPLQRRSAKGILHTKGNGLHSCKGAEGAHGESRSAETTASASGHAGTSDLDRAAVYATPRCAAAVAPPHARFRLGPAMLLSLCGKHARAGLTWPGEGRDKQLAAVSRAWDNRHGRPTTGQRQQGSHGPFRWRGQGGLWCTRAYTCAAQRAGTLQLISKGQLCMFFLQAPRGSRPRSL